MRTVGRSQPLIFASLTGPDTWPDYASGLTPNHPKRYKGQVQVVEFWSAVYGVLVTAAVLYIVGQWLANRIDRCTERRIRGRA